MRIQQLFTAGGLMIAMCAVVMAIGTLTGFGDWPSKDPLQPWLEEFRGYYLGGNTHDRVRAAYDTRAAQVLALQVVSWLQTAEATGWKGNPVQMASMNWAQNILRVLETGPPQPRGEAPRGCEDSWRQPGTRGFSFKQPYLKRFPDGAIMTPYGPMGDSGLLTAPPKSGDPEEAGPSIPDPAEAKAARQLPPPFTFLYNRGTNEVRAEFTGVDGKTYLLSVMYQPMPEALLPAVPRLPPPEYGTALLISGLLATAGMIILSLLLTRSLHDTARALARARDQGARGLEMPGGFVTEVQEIAEGVNGLVASLMGTVNRIGTMHDAARSLGESMRHFSARLTDHARRQRSTGDSAAEAQDRLRRAAQSLTEVAGNVGKESKLVLSESRALMEKFNGSAARVQTLQFTQAGLVGFTRKMYKIAKDSATDVSEGTRALDRSLSSLRSLHGAVESISERVDKISEIAEQTNLLALNAAIQAASGGEKGKSFALVAEEVRKLADLSADTTKEIVLQVQSTMEQINDGQKTLSEVYAVLTRLGESASELDRTLVATANALDQAGKDLAVIGEICQRVMEVGAILVRASETQMRAVNELSTQSDSLTNADRELEKFLRLMGEMSEKTGKEALELDRITRDLMGHAENLKLTIADLQEA